MITTPKVMPRQKRSISEPEKKIVAARQEWRCSSCKNILDATYQVDHTIPLVDDGPDHIGNMTAMCVTCHSRKTQHENAERARRRRAHLLVQPCSQGNNAPWHTRDALAEDVVLECGTLYKCSVCGETRPISIEWEDHRCRGRHTDVVGALLCFTYVDN